MRGATPALLIVTITGMLVLSPAPLSAQVLGDPTGHYRDQVKANIDSSQTLARFIRNNNFTRLDNLLQTGSIKSGSGNSGEAYFDLEPGKAYVFLGKCDDDCKNLSLALFDPSGTQIAMDTGDGRGSGDDHPPVVGAMVLRPGRYRVLATAKCDANFICVWAVQALSK
jgi:hypothetical protein